MNFVRLQCQWRSTTEEGKRTKTSAKDGAVMKVPKKRKYGAISGGQSAKVRSQKQEQSDARRARWTLDGHTRGVLPQNAGV